MDEMELVWDRTTDDPRHDRLVEQGWQPMATKAFFVQDLRDHPASGLPAGWTLETVSDVGEEEFDRLLRASAQGDPFEECSPTSLPELVETAGSLYDPRCWYVVSDPEGRFGVVLPQVYDDQPDTGSLFHVGVLPERRGEGLAADLQRWGIAELARRGAQRYVGSCDLRNAAMRAVFARNGLVQRRTQTFYRRAHDLAG